MFDDIEADAETEYHRLVNEEGYTLDYISFVMGYKHGHANTIAFWPPPPNPDVPPAQGDGSTKSSPVSPVSGDKGDGDA